MINIIQKNKLIDFFINNQIFSLEKSSSAVPYRIRLSRLCSYPLALRRIAHLFGDSMKKTFFDIVAGPYTDIPLATTISLEYNWPMIFVRNERKDYGMERLVEGNFRSGERVIVVDDEINDAEGALHLIGRLEGSGLIIEGLFVLLDREDGALTLIRKRGYRCEALLTLNDILVWLAQSGKIAPIQQKELEQFLKTTSREILTPQHVDA